MELEVIWGVTEVHRHEPGLKDQRAGADVTGHLGNLGSHIICRRVAGSWSARKRNEQGSSIRMQERTKRVIQRSLASECAGAMAS